ncbi:MAG: spinster family MFS transporter [Janthinobacterium lividum]
MNLTETRAAPSDGGEPQGDLARPPGAAAAATHAAAPGRSGSLHDAAPQFAFRLDSLNKVPGRNWYALVILTLIYACHFLDRMMVSIIVEPVRHEFHLTDSQIGLLTGLAYGVTFALAGIPLGLMIDRLNRVRLLAVLVAIWSGMTALSSVAQNFVQLLIARMGVGASEAGGSPTSLSLISDLFPPSKRSTAVGCFFLSNAVGAILAIFIGGFVAAKYGWRSAMLLAGVPGLILAVTLILTVREPRRGGTDAARAADAPPVPPAPGLFEVVRRIGKERAMLHLFGGISLASAGVATIGAWLPAFVMRFHGLNIKEAGLAVALASGFFGAFGSVIGGLMTDRLARTQARRRMDVSMAVCIGAALLAILGLMLPGSRSAVLALCVTQMVAFVVFPAAFGAMLGLAAPHMRGTTSASMQICVNLVGYGFGPALVGVLSDRFGGDQSLRYAMMTVTSLCFPWAALHFWLAARAFARRALTT